LEEERAKDKKALEANQAKIKAAEDAKKKAAEDKKAAKLLASAKKVIASKETKERKEYARLKKKFGDT
jgi:hypothetical protein